jgi:hypothetical protein
LRITELYILIISKRNPFGTKLKEIYNKETDVQNFIPSVCISKKKRLQVFKALTGDRAL